MPAALNYWAYHALKRCRMHSHKILRITPPEPLLQNKFSKELKVSKIVAQLLANRGVRDVDDAAKFLKVSPRHMLDPFSFADMPLAVERIKRAASLKEKVMIFGDYDVDGITSVALLKEALERLGIDALTYLPHRIKEGYGLNKNIAHIAKEKGVNLLITVDCGTSSHTELEDLKRNNIDTIITDHHEPATTDIPPAIAVINPKLGGSYYPFRELAGVGVAFKLCQALFRDLLVEDLDLVSLGTIADSVPLTGENRVIAKEGLALIPKTKRMGLRKLIESAGIKAEKFSAMHVGFMLGPRLNASGRMDTADTSLDLLLSKDSAEAEGLAKSLELHNRQRQKIEAKIMDEAQGLIDRDINFKEHKVIVIGKEDWHQGVLGIVASKLADKFYRPAIVISLTDDMCKGSARSIKSFHIFDALLGCKDLLHNFGGHAHAAGLSIARGNINDFRESINRLAHEKLSIEDLLPGVDIDMELSFADLNEDMIGELELLEPFGAGNPEPLFFTRSLMLKGQPQTMGRETMKFWATDGQTTIQAIGFGMSPLKESLLSAGSFDLIYTPRLDNWQGASGIILEIKDIFFH